MRGPRVMSAMGIHGGAGLATCPWELKVPGRPRTACWSAARRKRCCRRDRRGGVGLEADLDLPDDLGAHGHVVEVAFVDGPHVELVVAAAERGAAPAPARAGP